MNAMRRSVGLVAELLLWGLAFLAWARMPAWVGVPCLAGCVVLSIVRRLGGGGTRRRDPYDLRTLNETEPMPDDGREGPQDRSGYCPVCGHFIESPYKPCPGCGTAL